MAEDAPLRVDVVRSGGFAGIPTEASVDASALEPHEVEALERVVEQSKPPGPPAEGADWFQYDITVTRGSDRRTATFTENELPPEVGKVVERVLSLGAK
jgi:emfourin